MLPHLVDTHLHLDDEAFQGQVSDVFQRAQVAGVRQMIAVGTTAASSQNVLHLAEQFEGVYACVGIQPNYTAQATDADWERIREMAHHPRVVAIGETGLDQYWDYAPLDVQGHWFARHLALAAELDLPFVVHLREGKHGNGIDSCCQAIYDLIRSQRGHRNIRGVMHSYTGNGVWAERFLDLGLCISFAGMVTFKNASVLRETARRIPGDRILIETDAPYLTPEPYRGKWPNEPANLTHTAAALAEARGESLADLVQATTRNAQHLFCLAHTPP